MELDLARATDLHHYCITCRNASKLLLHGGTSILNFSLAVTTVIIMYLVVFSATNMHIYHKLPIGHLMQVWVRFALLISASHCHSNNDRVWKGLFQNHMEGNPSPF